jgi:protein phosphatase
MGMAGGVFPEAQVLALCPGDRLLLCSDGVTRLLTEEDVRASLLTIHAPDVLCQRLIEEANAERVNSYASSEDVFLKGL